MKKYRSYRWHMLNGARVFTRQVVEDGEEYCQIQHPDQMHWRRLRPDEVFDKPDPTMPQVDDDWVA